MLRPGGTVSDAQNGEELQKLDLPEVCPQIHNLPCAQSDQHAHSSQCEPFDALVGAFVRVPQLLFSLSQIFHLLHDLVDRLFYPPQFRLHGLQFLRRLHGRPIFRVSSNVDIEFDVT